MPHVVSPRVEAGGFQRLDGAVDESFFLDRAHDRQIPADEFVTGNFRYVVKVAIGAAWTHLVQLGEARQVEMRCW